MTRTTQERIKGHAFPVTTAEDKVTSSWLLHLACPRILWSSAWPWSTSEWQRFLQVTAWTTLTASRSSTLKERCIKYFFPSILGSAFQRRTDRGSPLLQNTMSILRKTEHFDKRLFVISSDCTISSNQLQNKVLLYIFVEYPMNWNLWRRYTDPFLFPPSLPDAKTCNGKQHW